MTTQVTAMLESMVTASGSSLNRILLIGPVLPYRGGIAQHTTMLHRALREEANCLTISFSRQYPRWLFPGKSDKEDSLSDYSEDGVEYLIDSMNPLSWYRAIKRAKEFSPRLVVFPWWHVYWAPCFLWMCKQLKKDGIEIIFLCHNAVDHEEARWKSFIGNFVLSNADRFVVHTSADKLNLQNRFPSISVSSHPLPVFDHFPPPDVELTRRASLEILFFGFIRPYKGLDILLEAMALLSNQDVHLSVVGEFWDGEAEALKYVDNHGISDKVHIVAQYVSDSEAAAYFARSDVVVLPYHSATGSAVIPLAYHYGKPVIATRVGGIPDVVKDGITGTLINPKSSDQLAKAITDVLTGATSYDKEEIRKLKNQFTWSGLAKTVLTSEDINS